jgi:ADP-dependent NAD(P)H-hydrate dehydratase / NAD(P)H-hydrate epimerase
MGKKIIKLLRRQGDLELVLSEKEALKNDAFTQNLGINCQILVEHAGKAVFDHVMKMLPSSKKSQIVFLVGLGNNGADALAAARHALARNLKITIYIVGEENSFKAEPAFQFALLKKILSHIKNKKDLIQFVDDVQKIVLAKNKFVVIVDGIFGAGLNRAPSGLSLLVMRFINRYRRHRKKQCRIVSIDIPSGLSLSAIPPVGEYIEADHTVTFQELKHVHISEPTKAICGHSYAYDIGLFSESPPTTFWIKKQKSLNKLFLPISSAAHKGKFGHVLVLEGDDRFLGASRLCAKAALRAGAGLVSILTQKDSQSGANLCETILWPLKEIDQIAHKIDALVLGPGLTQKDRLQQSAREVLAKLTDQTKLIVFDADALPLLKDKSLSFDNKFIVATPHPKEAAQLLDVKTQDIEKDRFSAIKSLGVLRPEIERKRQIIWVLKGATSLVRDNNGNVFAFLGDLPILAAAGSGDVLSGTIAGLVKQTPSPMAATLLAISLQLESGALLSKSIFKGSLASELVDLFPYLTKKRK